MHRTPIVVSSAAVLFLAAALLAQEQEPIERNEWARTMQPRPDCTIFSPLDLPTPNRVRTGSGAPGPDYWQQQADYRIEVALDPTTRIVRGHEHVTYVNHSPDALDYLWVHLEQNVLRPDSIGSLIEGGSAVGGPSEPSDGIQRLEFTANGAPLVHHVYDTLARVELPQALAPGGGRFEFDAGWEFRVPERVFRRYGTQKVKKGTVWEIAQWFPAVAVYDDVNGWNTLPYIGTGEFYTNFGTFDVAITAPRDHLVVATGVLQNPTDVYTATQRERLAQAKQSEQTVVIRGKDEVGQEDTRPAGDGPLTWKFHAEKVRTFAWASSEAFILDAAGLGETLVQSAYTEEVLSAWSMSTQMLRTAIKGYSTRWFPYPYPMATNVAGVEGGMEYPMIIFCRGRNERGLYGVTTHEIGHTWFPMVVDTDERRHAWMDEGFNSFINIYSTADWFGKASSPRAAAFGAFMREQRGVPIATAADRLDGMQLGMLEYQKTAVGLQILREYVLGAERFDYAFRTYIRRWAFKSPRPADFFRSMEDGSGMDLAWFWRGWFLESDTLDQAVDSVRQPQGDQGGSIVFTNLGRMVMPLTYQVKYADDTTERFRLPVELWFKSNRVTRRVTAGKEVREVRIDPDQALPDIERKNNVWTKGE